MLDFPPTIILRHRKENVKKCSLRGLETRADFCFYSYPTHILPDLAGYALLALDAPPLTVEDQSLGIFLLDATWRYAANMDAKLNLQNTIRRSIPPAFRTAYPRKQTDCPNPTQGLASIEAIYIAYHLLERDTTGLLDCYYWKDRFLDCNCHLFESPTLK